MVAKHKKKWFSVRTFYVWKAVGKVLKKDKDYSRKSVVLEERIVLFNCKTVEVAFKRARKEAEIYCSNSYINPYGEKIKYKLVGDLEAFEMYSAAKDGEEIFSITELCTSKEKLMKRLSYLVTSKNISSVKGRKRFGHG